MTHIIAHDRLPAHAEEGVVINIEPGPNGRYAHVTLETTFLRKNERKTNLLRFYLSKIIWGKYKTKIQLNTFWRFHFYLTSNESNGKLFLNCEVVKAIPYYIVGDNSQIPKPATPVNQQPNVPAPKNNQNQGNKNEYNKSNSTNNEELSSVPGFDTIEYDDCF